MKYSLKQKPVTLLALLTITTTLSACGGSNNTSSNNTAPVEKRTTNLGEIFTNKRELSLYTFHDDEPSISNCNGDCATKWPPLLANDDAQAEGRFSIITRADNSKQWALDKRPLYTWFKDEKPGDTTGEEIKSDWYVAQVAPISKVHTKVTSNGVENNTTVLTDTARKALYTFSKDINKPGGSACNDTCADKWPPLLANTDATSDGAGKDYTLITRDDKTKQWAYKGMPLYRWINDAAIGDTTGEGIKNVWFVAQPIPVSKFNTPEEGLTLTDTDHHSLYVLDNETTSNLICKGGCLTAWPPLYAKGNTTTRGDYTAFTNSEGKTQWAYKGQPLYRWKDDNKAGDTNGQGLAHPSGATWITAKP